ncbi:hypothetical protein AVEN_121029-1 [Araneus ventricosus]|uniref:Uncharacterized protein n=1 Tax=Araneus ventricosus TaxID=182803 RepID=A0A4Y2F215_ARAVE|nr:hypothetical protein AVEN_121029-1 [Araneus ventricosus]
MLRVSPHWSLFDFTSNLLKTGQCGHKKMEQSAHLTAEFGNKKLLIKSHCIHPKLSYSEQNTLFIVLKCRRSCRTGFADCHSGYRTGNRCQPLQSPRATVPTPPPAFRTGSQPRFPERASLLPPVCGLRFCERGSLPLTQDDISDLWLSAPNGKRDRLKIQFSSDCGIDDGFWNNGLQMVWSGALVNVQP